MPPTGDPATDPPDVITLELTQIDAGRLRFALRARLGLIRADDSWLAEMIRRLESTATEGQLVRELSHM